MELQMTDPKQLDIEFFENAPIIFSCYDKDLRLVNLNQSCLQLLKKQHKSEVIGKHVEEISPGIGETGRLAIYTGVMRSGKPVHLRSVVTVPALGSKVVGTYAF